MSACNHDINFAAVRTFRRVWNPIDGELQEAAEMDAAFDCGEFSGPAHGRMWERELNRIGVMVATAYGLTTEQLDKMVHCADMHNMDVLIQKGLY